MFPVVEKLPALCVMFPELEREVTEVPNKVLDPPDCTMEPEDAKLVCVPILVTLFWVDVSKRPVSVDPETSLDAATDPVTVKELPVMFPPLTLSELTVSAYKVPCE